MTKMTMTTLKKILATLRTLEGPNRSLLFQARYKENGNHKRKMTEGKYANTVSWKHLVKSGLLVFHVMLESHRGPSQKGAMLEVMIETNDGNFCLERSDRVILSDDEIFLFDRKIFFGEFCLK